MKLFEFRNNLKINFRLLLFLSATFFISSFFSCKKKHEKAPEKIIEKTEPADIQVRQILEEQLSQYKTDSLLIIDDDTLITSDWIYNLFLQNNFKPLWTNNESILPVADSLFKFIDEAEYYGLPGGFYNRHQLKSKRKLILDLYTGKINATRIYELNILLSDAFFKIAVYISKGVLNPDSLNSEWKGRKMDSTIVENLEKAIENNNIRETLDSFEPSSIQYRLLKNHLALFLTELYPKEHVFNLQNYEMINHTFNWYTDNLNVPEEDTTKFILVPDSLHQVLNFKKMQIEKIKMNLERLRWDNPSREDYYITINIPSFELNYFKCDTLSLISRVIVGKPDTRSPTRVDSRITHFYIYPYWTVPFSIATKEMLPILLNDTSYLTKHHMDIFDAQGVQLDTKKIKWKKYSEKYFPFRIRQRDGDENTLGVLKFMFNNKYGIYLHDTNSKGLFKKENRSLSHGCIRLEKAKQLSKEILSCCVINFNNDSLAINMKKKERKKVNLFKPLPIHIRYFTCESDSVNLIFYDDIYGLDNEMQKNYLLIDK